MALPKPFKYILVVLRTFVGLIFFTLLIIPTIVYSLYLRLSYPTPVPFHSHFITRITYLAAAMFPHQWYRPALAIRTFFVPGDRSMVVKRDTWTAYWVGTLETKKIPAETRGGDPTWKVSLKGVDMIMLYAHGGWVFGDAEMYNNIFCSWVQHFEKVHNKKLRILSVDYDLAPAKKFPYQRDQYLSAYRFLVEEIKWNPRKIIFGGDSCGGNILLDATYVLREHRLPPPRALLCISPWIRLDAVETTSPSMAHNRRTDFMPPQVFGRIARTYAGANREIDDPHISPFYVKDHSKFPELAMIYSGAEVLRDDCARFVDLYQSTGGRVTYHYMAEGMPHVYPLLRELAGKTAVKDAERRLMEWVNVLVEDNKVIFENRKRANAAAAAAAAAEASNAGSTEAAPAAYTLPPIQEPIHLQPSRHSPSPASRPSTPRTPHATRIVPAIVPSPNLRHLQVNHSQSGSSLPMELNQVVTEKSYGGSNYGSSQYLSMAASGDKEEFDEDRQDESDDEGDDDDVQVEMLVVDHH